MKLNCLILITISAAIALSGSSVSGAILTEETLVRLDGSQIQFYLSRPSSPSKILVPILLVVQGSACKTIYGAVLNAQKFVDQNNVARIDVEKVGINSYSTSCSAEYLNHNTVDQRITDYLRVIQSIRASAKSWWNGKILIVGGSEGGTIAPILASFIPETAKLVIMAGGTGWNMREEMLFLLKKKLLLSGSSSQETQAEVEKMTSTFEEIFRNPTSSKVYAGNTNTYKWWNSILNLRPQNVMLSLEIPILMIHGDADIAVPIESARATVTSFAAMSKLNLKFIEYPGLDHHWNNSLGESQALRVLEDVFDWLLN